MSGAYGHISHLYEDFNVSFNDILRIVKDFVYGVFDKKNYVKEKIDGVNLMITYKDGEVRFARNKNHLKDYGKQSLDYNQFKSKFSDNKNVKDAFENAADFLINSFSKINDSKLYKFFKNGKIFLNIEIVYPASAEIIIPYDDNNIIFHNFVEYDIDGNVIDNDAGDVNKFYELFNDIKIDGDFKFNISSNIKLEKLDDYKEVFDDFKSKLDKILKRNGLNYDNKIIDLIVENLVKDFGGDFLKHNNKLSDSDLYEIFMYIVNKSYENGYKLNQLKKDLSQFDDDFLKYIYDWYKVNYKESVSKYLEDLRILLSSVSVKILKHVYNIIPVKTSDKYDDLKSKLADYIDKIRELGNQDDLNRLNKILSDIEKSGASLSDVIPMEGVVFKYKDKIYKFTGLFQYLIKIRMLFNLVKKQNKIEY